MQMRPLHQGAELSCKVMEGALLECLGVFEVVRSQGCKYPSVTLIVLMVTGGILALVIPAIMPTQVFPMVKAQARTARWDLGTSARLTTCATVSFRCLILSLRIQSTVIYYPLVRVSPLLVMLFTDYMMSI